MTSELIFLRFTVLDHLVDKCRHKDVLSINLNEYSAHYRFVVISHGGLDQIKESKEIIVRTPQRGMLTELVTGYCNTSQIYIKTREKSAKYVNVCESLFVCFCCAFCSV